MRFRNWKQGLPPGLRELAEQENLSDANIKQLFDAYDTIRGKRPVTLDEWYVIYNVVRDYFRDDYGEKEQ